MFGGNRADYVSKIEIVMRYAMDLSSLKYSYICLLCIGCLLIQLFTMLLPEQIVFWNCFPILFDMYVVGL